MWAEFAKWAPKFKSAVITGFDASGYPLSARCHPQLDPAQQLVLIDMPAGVAMQAGAASLLMHSHDDKLWNQTSYMVRGQLEKVGETWKFKPETYTPGMGVHGIWGLIQFVRKSRHTAAAYLAKRNLPRPTIPWEKINAVKS